MNVSKFKKICVFCGSSLGEKKVQSLIYYVTLTEQMIGAYFFEFKGKSYSSLWVWISRVKLRSFLRNLALDKAGATMDLNPLLFLGFGKELKLILHRYSQGLHRAKGSWRTLFYLWLWGVNERGQLMGSFEFFQRSVCESQGLYCVLGWHVLFYFI